MKFIEEFFISFITSKVYCLSSSVNISSSLLVHICGHKTTPVPASYDLTRTSSEVCVVYDDCMTTHFDYSFDDTHPERPDRIRAVQQRLGEFGLLDRCRSVASRKAEDRELEEVGFATVVGDVSNTRIRIVLRR